MVFLLFGNWLLGCCNAIIAILVLLLLLLCNNLIYTLCVYILDMLFAYWHEINQVIAFYYRQL